MELAKVKQCTVLFVNPNAKRSPHPGYLREIGFLVDESADWPAADDAVRKYHVVVVYVWDMNRAPMIAARLRAKPHFGRRLLIALADPGTSPQDRRVAEAAGFDDVVDECCKSRLLTARILRRIRARPELRCALPPPPRRSAA